MATQFALCPEDREKYGGPEWVTYDKDALDDMPIDVLDPVERQIFDLYKVSIGELIFSEFGKGTVRGIRSMVWLARQVAGITTDPQLAEFNIKARKVRMRVEPVADAVPPDSASSTPSPEEAPSETPTAP